MITFAPDWSARVTMSARSRVDSFEASSTATRSPGPAWTGPRAPGQPGRWPRNRAEFQDSGIPAASVLRADCDGVTPITRPVPAARHARPASVSTVDLPDPAGALITYTRRGPPLRPRAGTANRARSAGSFPAPRPPVHWYRRYLR